MPLKIQSLFWKNKIIENDHLHRITVINTDNIIVGWKSRRQIDSQIRYRHKYRPTRRSVITSQSSHTNTNCLIFFCTESCDHVGTMKAFWCRRLMKILEIEFLKCPHAVFLCKRIYYIASCVLNFAINKTMKVLLKDFLNEKIDASLWEACSLISELNRIKHQRPTAFVFVNFYLPYLGMKMWGWCHCNQLKNQIDQMSHTLIWTTPGIFKNDLWVYLESHCVVF